MSWRIPTLCFTLILPSPLFPFAAPAPAFGFSTAAVFLSHGFSAPACLQTLLWLGEKIFAKAATDTCI